MGSSPIRTAKKSRPVAALFCGAYIAHLFSLLRKRAHYHSLGGPPGRSHPPGSPQMYCIFWLFIQNLISKKCPHYAYLILCRLEQTLFFSCYILLQLSTSYWPAQHFASCTIRILPSRISLEKDELCHSHFSLSGVVWH